MSLPALITDADIIAVRGNDKYVLLTDPKGTGTPDLVQSARACMDASDKAYGLIQNRYPLPFDTVPDLLKRLVVALAVRYLGIDGVSLTEDDVKQADAAERDLTLIGQGKMKLGIAEPQPPSVDGRVRMVPVSRRGKRRFTEIL